MRRHLEVFRRVLVFIVAQVFAAHSAWAADPDNPAEIRVRQVPESQVVAMGQAIPEVGAQVVYAFFPDVAYTAIVSRVAQVATGITAIRSETPDGRNTTCLAVISADGMRITVRDYDRRRLYQCVSLRDGGYECREYDLSRELPRVSAPSLVPPGRTGEKTETVAPFDSTGGGDSGVLPTATVYLDVMIVFDTAAQTWAAANGGIASFAADAIARMNAAMQTSGIDCTFRLAATVLKSYSSGSDLYSSLYDITDNTGVFSDIETLRTTYGADLVTLMIDTGSAYGTVGIGWVLFSEYGDARYAYTACAIRSVNQSHTLTHEIGHNLGCGHAVNQKSSPGPELFSYSAGYYFTASGNDYHTIMAYNSDGYGGSYDGCDYFSTPLKTFASSGVVVGNAGTADNARTIRETMSVASAYRSSVLDPTATVTVSATDASAGEPGTGLGNGTFTFSRSGSTAAALTVNFTVSGTATAGSDYTALGTTVGFAAGAASATKTVSVLNDATVESSETVVVTLSSGTGYTVGSPSSATVNISSDDVSAIITVSATDASAGEPGTGLGSGTFTFSRSGSTAAALTVSFTVGGTATAGSDYTALGATVSFAVGASTATKTVAVLDDATAESSETVVITLAPGTGYTVGSPSSATVNISSDDLGAPSGVIASDGSYADRVLVSWNAATGATSYWIYRNTANASATASLYGEASSPSFTDTRAEPGVTYYYWVKARNGVGTSGFSNGNDGWRAFTATTVRATDGVFFCRTRLSWTAVPGAGAYKLYRAASAGGAKTALTGWTTDRQHDDKGGALNTIYYYFVQPAANTAGLHAGPYSAAESGHRSSSVRVAILSLDPCQAVRLTAGVQGAPAIFTVQRAASEAGPFIDTGIVHYQAVNGEKTLYVPSTSAGEYYRVLVSGSAVQSVWLGAIEEAGQCLRIGFERASTAAFPVKALRTGTLGGGFTDSGVGLTLPAGDTEAEIVVPCSGSRGYYRLQGVE